MPMISNPPSGRISATMAAIFEVPISRPTMSFLLSRDLFIRVGPSSRAPHAPGLRLLVAQLRHAHGEAVGVAQVHVVDAALQASDGAVVQCDEARKARFDVLAAEFQRKSVVQLDLPGAARIHLDLHRRLADRSQAALEVAVLDGDLPRGAFGPD